MGLSRASGNSVNLSIGRVSALFETAVRDFLAVARVEQHQFAALHRPAPRRSQSLQRARAQRPARDRSPAPATGSRKRDDLALELHAQSFEWHRLALSLNLHGQTGKTRGLRPGSCRKPWTARPRTGQEDIDAFRRDDARCRLQAARFAQGPHARHDRRRIGDRDKTIGGDVAECSWRLEPNPALTDQAWPMKSRLPTSTPLWRRIA